MLKKMMIAAVGRGGRSCGSRAVEGAARENQAAAGISDLRVGRRRGQRAVARAKPGRHGVRRHVERRQRVRAARREQGRQSRPRHHRSSAACGTCPTASRSATARCMSPRSTASSASTTSSRSSRTPGTPAVVTDKLPSDRHHGWKFIRFGPDGLLYVPVGAPCNICDRGDPYATILRMKPDGSGMEVFARGVRNTVGFDWHPTTRELWFTDNGRDKLGDDTPGDELNRAPKAGHALRLSVLPRGHDRRSRVRRQAPVQRVRAAGAAARAARGRDRHALLHGLAVSRSSTATRSSSPSTARGTAAAALPFNGNRIAIARLQGNKVVRYEPFAEGWLEGRNRWGRPADLEVLPDGSMLVSDDQAGVIYRISLRGEIGCRLESGAELGI